MIHGPNFKRLVVWKMTMLTIPADCEPGQGFNLAIETLRDPERLAAIAREAQKFAEDSIAIVKACRDPRYQDEETIAKVIMDGVDEARRKRR